MAEELGRVESISPEASRCEICAGGETVSFSGQGSTPTGLCPPGRYSSHHHDFFNYYYLTLFYYIFLPHLSFLCGKNEPVYLTIFFLSNIQLFSHWPHPEPCGFGRDALPRGGTPTGVGNGNSVRNKQTKPCFYREEKRGTFLPKLQALLD